VAQLREQLAKEGMPTTGVKAALVDRLATFKETGKKPDVAKVAEKPKPKEPPKKKVDTKHDVAAKLEIARKRQMGELP
jgi:hypothetical protein